MTPQEQLEYRAELCVRIGIVLLTFSAGWHAVEVGDLRIYLIAVLIYSLNVILWVDDWCGRHLREPDDEEM